MIYNPVRYSDPSGHRFCEGAYGPDFLPKSSYTKQYYQEQLSNEYSWKVDKSITYQETKFLYEVAWDMRLYYSNVTSGHGKSWMDKNIGEVIFNKTGDFVQKSVSVVNNAPTSLVLLQKTIHLMDNFMALGKRHVAHEVIHVSDNKMGGGLATFFGGGPADELVKFTGGTPNGLRWVNGNIDVPREYQFKSKDYQYANNSNADYYAESMAFLIYPNINSKTNEPEPFPKPGVKLWLEAMIDLSK